MTGVSAKPARPTRDGGKWLWQVMLMWVLMGAATAAARGRLRSVLLEALGLTAENGSEAAWSARRRSHDTEQVSEFGDWVRVDPRAAQPLFDQLRTQVIAGVRGGQLPPGARLPTVRELALRLGLAVNTVARAYRELESAGILETRGRFGTFVATQDPADVTMAAAARAFADTARALGIDPTEALRYVHAALR